MGVNVVSLDTVRAKRRQATFEQPVAYELAGEIHTVTKRVVNGEMELLDLSRPLGEMITSAAGRKELLEKVVLDVELGREQVPTLYGPIYDKLSDPNFPEVFDAKWAQYGVVVFAEHIEGEEVKFGHLQAEEGPVARIKTYTAGFQYTEDMVEYNRTFDFETLSRGFGEAHNALLNHIYLSPIFSYTYQGKNKTAPVYVDIDGKHVAKAESNPLLSMRETLRKGIADARREKRQGSILLVHGSRVNEIQDALSRLHIRGTDYASTSGVDTIIAYDGWSARVGEKEYTYSGVPENKAYLIRPKRGFKELEKHGLRIDAGDGDISRLILSQIVGRSRIGVYAALEENVQEITLPDYS